MEEVNDKYVSMNWWNSLHGETQNKLLIKYSKTMSTDFPILKIWLAETRPAIRMRITEAKDLGFTVDTTVYPHFGYRGNKYQPSERIDVYPDDLYTKDEIIEVLNDLANKWSHFAGSNIVTKTAFFQMSEGVKKAIRKIRNLDPKRFGRSHLKY